jgi:DNA-binding LytR/AlgR family response regulator
MAFYSCIGGVTVFLFAKILKSFRFFSNLKDWIVIKEILSVLLILIGLGIIIFLIGQLIEPVGHRSKIATLLNSCKYGFLVGIMPFTFFSAMNYRYLFPQHDDEYIPIQSQGMATENLIKISSQLKKEELKFYPSEFLYAESDSNYVVFYLFRDELVKKEVIRNSINNVEQQLSEIPYFLRIHRAFIVNLKKVRSKHGNTLGYQIKLSGIDSKIPVSRSNTSNFNKLFAEYYK